MPRSTTAAARPYPAVPFSWRNRCFSLVAHPWRDRAGDPRPGARPADAAPRRSRMLKDLRIRTRVFAALATALMLSLLLGGVALWSTRSLRHSLDRVSAREFPGTVLLAEIGQALETAARAVNVLLVRDTAPDQVLRAANHDLIAQSLQEVRSEERRVGKECRSRWA